MSLIRLMADIEKAEAYDRHEWEHLGRSMSHSVMMQPKGDYY